MLSVMTVMEITLMDVHLKFVNQHKFNGNFVAKADAVSSNHPFEKLRHKFSRNVEVDIICLEIFYRGCFLVKYRHRESTTVQLVSIS